jgi:hypothetical protein
MSLYREFLRDGACNYCALENRIAKSLMDQGIDPMGIGGLCSECYGKFKNVFRKLHAEGMAQAFCHKVNKLLGLGDGL